MACLLSVSYSHLGELKNFDRLNEGAEKEQLIVYVQIR
jgi:hypothetical protein